MLKDSYITNETENLIRYLSGVLCGEDDPDDIVIDREDEPVSEEAAFYSDIKRKISEKDINGAENALYDMLEQLPGTKILIVALKFYSDISRLDDIILSECDFTRTEILEGLQEIEKLINC